MMLTNTFYKKMKPMNTEEIVLTKMIDLII